MSISRRTFLASTSLIMAPAVARGATVTRTEYPMQEPELVQEMVIVSHSNVARVKALVGRQQTLAKASWDWGFGDWEAAVDAASHVGNREIAEFLLANRARPTIFSAAMLGQLDAVKALVAANPGIQRTKGPHSITLLQHAVNGGPRAQAVVEYLKSLGDADEHVAQQPLSPEDVQKLSGIYTFGPSPSARVDITAANGQLNFGRPGRFSRPLYYLGGYEFCPAGGENVRVRFTESAAGVTLTVHDPDVVLTATKAPAKS